MKKSSEYFLDCTGKREIFTKNAHTVLFTIDFTTKDYQYFKKLASGYNYINEGRKVLIAKEDNTLFLVEHSYTTLEKLLSNGSVIFQIG